MIKEQTWNGWRSVALEAGGFRLIVPLEFGPRVLFFGRAEGENLFHVMTDEDGAGPDGNYFFRGGHRLWHAPEHPVRTYQPDNDELEWRRLADDSFFIGAPVEAATGIRKELEISVSAAGPVFRVLHRLVNRNLWSVELAPWALTVFPPGGTILVPLPPKGEHPRDLLPEYHVVPWTYTDFSLPAWKFNRRFFSLDTRRTDRPQKVGVSPGGTDWLAYWRKGTVFVKRAAVFPGNTYPDRGCATEVFSDGEMAELETLGPAASVGPGESVVHVEEWRVLEEIPEPADDATWEKRILAEVERQP